MRIQVLELPAIIKGDDVETPFLLVFDEVETSDVTTARGDVVRRIGGLKADLLQTYAEQAGAVGSLAFTETVEVVR